MTETRNSSTSLDPNVAAALSYGLGWVTGVAFLLIEHENRFVRFHAMQSTLVFLPLCIVWVVLTSIPILGMLVDVFLILPLAAVLWLVLMFKAYQGEWFKLPIAGDMAEQRI